MLLLFFSALIAGLVLLLWSADKFVDGGAASAKHLGVPTLLIGILIIGFGTSAPEMLVSLIAALDGNPQLALGNAFGSNITNIALIIGTTALVAPIVVHSRIISKELPLVLAITILSGWMVYDGVLSFFEGLILLTGFGMLVVWSIYGGLKARADSFSCEMEQDLQEHEMTLKESLFWLFAGIVLLIASSKLLVWGAVGIATALGVSDLVIGLTIVALGTSLPELSSCIVAVKEKKSTIWHWGTSSAQTCSTSLPLSVSQRPLPLCTTFPKRFFTATGSLCSRSPLPSFLWHTDSARKRKLSRGLTELYCLADMRRIVFTFFTPSLRGKKQK